MNLEPEPLRCAACGEMLTTLEDLGFCVLCTRLFCVRHLTVRKGVANCPDCAERRKTLEQTGGVSEFDEERVVSLLLQDVATTIGTGHEGIVEEAAARIRLFCDDTADFEQRVVDDVQQYFHDSFVDTTWPRCPDHPNHPLWYSAHWWRCEQLRKAVAPLGGLRERDRR